MINHVDGSEENTDAVYLINQYLHRKKLIGMDSLNIDNLNPADLLFITKTNFLIKIIKFHRRNDLLDEEMPLTNENLENTLDNF
jgi:hypothetical protein